MIWIQLAAGLVKLANLVMGMVDREQVLKLGEDRNVVKAVESINADVEQVRGSILAIRSNPVWAERLRKLADRDG